MKSHSIYIIVAIEEEFVLVHSLVEFEKEYGVVFCCVTNDDKASKVFF